MHNNAHKLVIALTWSGGAKVKEDEGMPMIGVVVWSNSSREKAVIWCEDQASLAYLQGRENLLGPDLWPEPGDLLELDCEMIGNLRHARSVSVLSEHCCPQLPELLRQSGNAQNDESHLKLVVSRETTARDRFAASVWTQPLRVGSAR